MGDGQQANHSGFVEGFELSFLSPTTMTSLQTSQAIPSICLLPYSLPPLSSGVLIQNQPPVLVPLQPASVVKDNRDVSTGPKTVDFNGYLSQLETPPPAFPVTGGATTYQRHQDAPEMALQRRELRLKSNRESAKRSRKKKAQYIRFLENRVEELENENKMLKEYLRTLILA